MPSLETFGLRVVEVSDAAGLAAELGRAPDERPHVVRVDGASDGRCDLVVRPTWIHWVCGAADLMGR